MRRIFFSLLTVALLAIPSAYAAEFANEEFSDRVLATALGPGSSSSNFTINHCPIGFRLHTSAQNDHLQDDLELALRISKERKFVDRRRLFVLPFSYFTVVQQTLKKLGSPAGLSASCSEGNVAIFYVPSSANNSSALRIRKILEYLAIAYVKTDNRAKAREIIEEILKVGMESGDPLEVASTLESIGDVERVFGDFREAEATYKKAVDEKKKYLGEEAPELAESYFRLAYCKFDQLQNAEAQRYLRYARKLASEKDEHCIGCRKAGHNLTPLTDEKMRLFAQQVIEDKSVDEAEYKAEADAMKALLLSELPATCGNHRLNEFLANERIQAESDREGERRKRAIQSIEEMRKDYLKRIRDAIAAASELARRHQQQALELTQRPPARDEWAGSREMEQRQVEVNSARNQSITGTSYMSRY